MISADQKSCCLKAPWEKHFLRTSLRYPFRTGLIDHWFMSRLIRKPPWYIWPITSWVVKDQKPVRHITRHIFPDILWKEADHWRGLWISYRAQSEVQHSRARVLHFHQGWTGRFFGVASGRVQFWVQVSHSERQLDAQFCRRNYRRYTMLILIFSNRAIYLTIQAFYEQKWFAIEFNEIKNYLSGIY